MLGHLILPVLSIISACLFTLRLRVSRDRRLLSTEVEPIDLSAIQRHPGLNQTPVHHRLVLRTRKLKTRVIGLGNPVLSDEAVGLLVAREVAHVLRERSAEAAEAVVESEVGGLAFLDLLCEWDRVIIVDAVHFEGAEPGTLFLLGPTDFLPSIRLRAVHEIDLPSALALGKELGKKMPDVVHILGIQAKDTFTFGTEPTPSVSAAIPKVVEKILELLSS
jgi:hydrogenase maturation protease